MNKVKTYFRSFFVKILDIVKNNKSLSLVVFAIAVALLIYFMPSSFATLQPIRSVETFSKNLNYESNEPGAWKVTNSAKWISKDKAQVSIDVESILKKNKKNTDILLVLNVSSSMYDKLDQMKIDVTKMISSSLSESDNRMGLITYDTTAEVVSDFTNNKEELISKVDNLKAKVSSSFYQAFLKVDDVLGSYENNGDRECVVLFLTSSLPILDTPNEVGQYNYLKNKYPFMNLNLIQYEMGDYVFESFKKISDKQFLADKENLFNTLLDASAVSIKYDNFKIAYQVNSEYFVIDDFFVNQGDVVIDKNQQTINWNMNFFRTGSSSTLTINLIRKPTENENVFITGQNTFISSEVDGIIESVDSSETPILKDNFSVIYDANAPSGCLITDVPSSSKRSIFDTVEISNVKLTCEGYQFKGWKVANSSLSILNNDYFVMPEDDVKLIGEWSKISLKKSMNGSVYQYVPPTLQSVSHDYYDKIWNYKTSVTKVIFQDEINDISKAIANFDISEEKNGALIGYVVPNADNTTHTVYIQADGKIMANSNSSYLFSGFSKLNSIEGLQYLDTSNAINMEGMFNECSELTDLDVSNFKTINVTNMQAMFGSCSKLVSLDLNSFDTQNVKSMGLMFFQCTSLQSLNLSSFDTTKLEDMSSMFHLCKSLNTLNLSNFNTPNVVDMKYMFSGCMTLRTLNLSNFNTSKVTDMGYMFCNCYELRNLNLSNFNFLKVTRMDYMFLHCYVLTTTINILNNSVTSYVGVFEGASTTAGTKISVNYTTTSSSLVDKMVATKSSNSNVMKGSRK